MYQSDQMYQSEQINELIAALAKAQGAMSSAAKDSSNPFFRSKYAGLSSIWNACREPLSVNGLGVVQTIQQRESGDVLFTILGHSSGQWISSTIPIRIKSDGKTNELQVMGSCLTYLRRYALSAIVGVAPEEDDDANSAKDYQATREAEPIKPKTITAQQAETLRSTLAQCSPTLKDNISKVIKERGLDGLHMIGEGLFNSIMTRAVQDMKEYQESLCAQEVVAV